MKNREKLSWDTAKKTLFEDEAPDLIVPKPPIAFEKSNEKLVLKEELFLDNSLKQNMKILQRAHELIKDEDETFGHLRSDSENRKMDNAINTIKQMKKNLKKDEISELPPILDFY